MLSIPHLIIIFVVALVVFGPEKLPELARTLGKVMSEFRRATGDLRSTFEEHLRDLEREADTRRIGPSSPPQQIPNASVPSAGTVPTSPPNSPERGAAPSATEGVASTSSPQDLSDSSKTGKTEQSSETMSDGHAPA